MSEAAVQEGLQTSSIHIKLAVILSTTRVNYFIPTRHIYPSFQFITSARREYDLFIHFVKTKS